MGRSCVDGDCAGVSYRFVNKWGFFGGGNGQFIFPQSGAVDSSGSVYVADTVNHRIQEFRADGTFVGTWGGFGGGDGQFNDPRGVAVDEEGNVYVADINYHRIQVFAPG